jgi:hypothetical protein
MPNVILSDDTTPIEIGFDLSTSQFSFVHLRKPPTFTWCDNDIRRRRRRTRAISNRKKTCNSGAMKEKNVVQHESNEVTD